MIEIEGLTVKYGSLVAVDSLSLHVPSGSVFGFIGPNGAGKTTTMRVLATLLVPDAGKAKIAGIDVVHFPEKVKPLIGYMPDFFGVYDNLKVHEYLACFGGIYGLNGRKLQDKIDEVLALAKLEGKRDDYVEHLSRGMKQRLCLARTLLHEPEVLILDEPASGLDPRARIEIRELLQHIARMGKTVFVSSHILPELSDICNSVGIIEKGKLVHSGAVGETKELREGVRLLRLRTKTADKDRVLALLESFEPVKKVELHQDIFHVTVPDDDENVADLVDFLVANGVRLTLLAEYRSDLEELFMRVTKGEVQ